MNNIWLQPDQLSYCMYARIKLLINLPRKRCVHVIDAHAQGYINQVKEQMKAVHSNKHHALMLMPVNVHKYH